MIEFKGREIGYRKSEPGSRCQLNKSGQFIARHGLAKARNPIYVAWKSIRRRCNDDAARDFKYYGGRGIQMYAPWVSDPIEFVSYVESVLGPKIDKTYTLDRIDNNGNYEPGNLRWATKITQQNNKRSNRLIAYQGKSLTLQEWSRQTGLASGTIRARFVAGHSLDRVFSPEVRGHS